MSNPDYDAPPDKFPENGSNASGTTIAYSVQARRAYVAPEVVCGHILDLRWITIDFPAAKAGVPVRDGIFPCFSTLGLLTYQAAQALRWWFVAEAEKTHSHLCLQTRLIEHEINYSYSATAKRACEAIGGDNDSSHMNPRRNAVTTGQQEDK